jgi:hypothetical protein
MTYRHETIAEAYCRTFEWIFQDRDIEGNSWSKFSEWLESGSGIYWIKGKAGSGKSTLMRYIVDDPRTHGYLEGWTRNETLEAHSFFFWASGEAEQRSQADLLGSILHDVLQKHPDLIALVFGVEWP